MIKTMTVVNRLGDSLIIDVRNPEKSGFVVRDISGVGPVEAVINMSELATDNGSMFESSRSRSRTIDISLSYHHTSNPEELRTKIYKYFPVSEMINLYFTTDSRSAVVSGYVEKAEPDYFRKDSFINIKVKCPRSDMYATDENRLTKTLFYGVEPLFELPFSNEVNTSEINMGNIVAQQNKIIKYEGDIPNGVEIFIKALGPVTGLQIYNIDARESIVIDNDILTTITGNGIISGDEIYINTVKGEKAVTLLRNGVSTNILNALGHNPHWFTLHKGDNMFAYTSTTGFAELQFRMQNRTLYGGI